MPKHASGNSTISHLEIGSFALSLLEMVCTGGLCRTMNPFLKIGIQLLFGLTLVGQQGHAQDHPREFTYFKDNYLTIEAVKNVPVSHTQNRFESRYTTIAAGYRHALMQDWMMGLSANLKSLKEADTSADLSFLALSHEATRIFRIYHPDYLLLGPKIMYLFPMNKTRLPLVKHPDIATEVGVGLTASLVHQINPDTYLQLRLDRWRGTKTNKFHGIETAIGFGFSL